MVCQPAQEHGWGNASEGLPFTGCTWIWSFDDSRVVESLEFIFIVTLRKSDSFTFQEKLLKHLCFSFVIGLMPADAGEKLPICSHVSWLGQWMAELWQVARWYRIGAIHFWWQDKARNKTRDDFQFSLSVSVWAKWSFVEFTARLYSCNFLPASEMQKGRLP